MLGQTVTITVGGSGFRGTLFGFLANVPFNAGCSCWFGVDPSITYPNPMVWTVPVNPVYVGLPLAVQGWSFSGSQCLGTVDQRHGRLHDPLTRAVTDEPAGTSGS